MIGIGILILFLLLVVLRTPVALAMGISAILGFFLAGHPVQMIPMIMQNTVENSNYLAIILFILVGNVANATKLSERIFDFAIVMVGSVKGGLAQANILASMIFAGMSGSGIADCAGLGIVEVKKMTDYGYKPEFSAAVTAASSVIGPIIPPSISLIIYAILANVSIAQILLAGLIPGLFIGMLMMVLVYFLAATKRVHIPPPIRTTVREKGVSFCKNFTALLAPLILLSGFAFGVVSPSESGALAILYTIIIAVFRRETTWKKLYREGFMASLLPLAQIMFILAAAAAFCWILSREQVYVHLGNIIISICDGNRYLFWLLVNVFYLLNGCFVPGIATLVITVPLFAPLLPQFGIDPLQFGVVIVLNDMIGMVTPPIGSGIFIMMAITKVKYEALIRNLLPFIVMLFVSLLCLVVFPGITTILPRLIFQ
ncbi:MAG: TRAP transporter large permease [Deltaproteobacteria bacterium]|nr:TRAP transporter large permease [Deltaproteobacteria bacterium]